MKEEEGEWEYMKKERKEERKAERIEGRDLATTTTTTTKTTTTTTTTTTTKPLLINSRLQLYHCAITAFLSLRHKHLAIVCWLLNVPATG